MGLNSSWFIGGTVGLCCALLTSGCAGELEVNTAQQRVVEGAASQEIMDAAAEVLRREFGRASIDHASRRIETDAVEFDAERGSGTARDLVGASTRMRRFAVCSLSPRDDGALVRMRVDIERQDTSRRAAARQDTYPGDDRPSFTPIERDAGTTERQNTVWTRVRRDRTLERQLLDELADRFAPDGGVAAPRAAAPAPESTSDPDERVRVQSAADQRPASAPTP